ncbi:MAG TPA: hypothetical protein VFT52_02415 [Luteimonas sp.]|jgi:hypothetical protein|nr:hypothetical protein [Luteimonas sp.]
MSKFEVNPSRGMRAWAVVLAVTGIGSLVFSGRISSRVVGAILLLGAWEAAFVPSLPLNLTLGQVYRKARQGWRMSRTARIINYVMFALIILATYLQLHGR